MNRIQSAFLAALALLVAAFATPAFAQDYTLTNVSGQIKTVPTTGVTALSLGDDSNRAATLPFSFPYFGGATSTVYIHSNGYMQIRPTATPTGSTFSNSAWPPAGSGNTDAMVAPLWDDMNQSSGGTINYFTTGTAPNRVFVASWNAIAHYGGTGNYTFQIHLYETTGRIVFAYEASSTTWTGLTASIGIRAPGTDTRFVTPNSSNTISTKPTVDYQFDPNPTVFTGRLVMDAFQSDSTGYGNSVISGVPCTGLNMELRDSTGATVGFGTVDANGDYSLAGLALKSTSSGSVHAVTSSGVCKVSASTSLSSVPAYSLQIVSSVSFAAGASLGTATIDDVNDTGGAFRKPAQICAAIGRAYNWVTRRSSKPISQIDVFYSDLGSTERSRYAAPSGPTPAYLRIGSAASGNLDAYDTGIVMRGYARHLVRALTGAAVPNGTLALDSKTDDINALADGLGAYLYALTDGATKEYDATSASAATTFDYESPFLTTAKGSDVGGWFVPAMFDLIDGANEPHDVIDGTLGLAAERPFLVLDSLTTLSMVDFALAWQARGYDGIGLVKDLVYHGVLRDDASESDDTSATAFDLGTAGAIVRGRTLNPFNEDWYKINVPAPTSGFYVDMVYNSAATSAVVLLEVRSPGGAVFATGAYDLDVGALRAVTGALPAGQVFIRIVHQSGGHLGTHDLQAFSLFGGAASSVPEWTVGRPFAQTVTIFGGVAPYTVAVKKAEPLPTGLILDALNPRVYGTPANEGTTIYTLNIADSGAPVHSATITVTLKVNSELTFTAPLLTGVAVGKVSDVSLGRSGGTNPVTVSNQTGQIPEGLTLTPDFHITGTTNQAGGGQLAFTATDVAGSTTNVSTTLVACEQHPGGKLPVDLGAGSSAAGFYFDTVAGSVATIDLSTVRKRAVRGIQVLLVGPDGAAVEGGLVKVRPGKASLKNVPLAESGRYFLVFQGADQGAASQLLAGLKVKLPSKGAGSNLFDFGDKLPLELGALDGAVLTIQGTTTLGMNMRVDSLTRPDGSRVDVDTVAITQANGKFKISATLDQSGTWGIVLAPQLGPVGVAKFKISIKQPKGVEYSAD